MTRDRFLHILPETSLFGAEETNGPKFFRPGQAEYNVFSGTEAEALRRVRFARACIDVINSAGKPYTLFTGPRGGREAPDTPTFNSNSVSAALLQCMGVPIGNPAISSQVGFKNPVLDPDQIREIRGEQNPAQPPSRTIPTPAPRSKRRGGISDGSSAVAIGDGAGRSAWPIKPSPPYLADAESDQSRVGPSAATQPFNALQQTSQAAASALPPHVVAGANYLSANGVPVTHRSMYLASVYGPQRVVDAINNGQVGSLRASLPDEQTQQQIRSWVQGWHGRAPAAPADVGGPMPYRADAPGSGGAYGPLDEGPDDWILESSVGG